jgi:hypothetical protein
MINGVATLTSATRFYKLHAGVQVSASNGTLQANSTAFNVVANAEMIFAGDYESCRL